MLNIVAGTRPFPIDSERKERCNTMLMTLNMTQAELAMHLGVSCPLISAVISGRQPSKTIEERIANFFGVPKEYLFPVRSGAEIAQMRQAEAEAKARVKLLKDARMEIRDQALSAKE